MVVVVVVMMICVVFVRAESPDVNTDCGGVVMALAVKTVNMRKGTVCLVQFRTEEPYVTGPEQEQN